VLTRILKYGLLLIIFLMAVSGSAYFTLTRLMKSRDIVVVPILEGKEIVYTLELLTGLGLNIKVKGSEYSSEIPKNHIVFQDPSPGKEIKKGRDVRIVLSKGPASVIMPNLTGLDRTRARIILEENDLCLNHISYTDIRQGDGDNVIAQVPAPGSITRRGKCANLLVGSGIRRMSFQMPDLKGISLEKAIPAMEKYGIVIGTLKTVSIEDIDANTIVDQSPGTGFRIIENEPVELTVNRLKESPDLSRYSLFKGPNLFMVRAGNGFLNTRIRLHLNLPGISMDLYDDFLKPGREAWVLVPSNRGAGLFLYENDELVEAKIYD
jgi:eukaryotic-like serine/threonine-protein kinase